MLKHLKIWQKFALTAAMAIIPTLVLLWFLVVEQSKSIDSAQRELVGLDYLDEFDKLRGELAQHREILAAWKSGNAAAQQQLQRKQADIDAAFDTMDRLDKKLGNELGSSEDFDELRAAWQSLRLDMPKLTPGELRKRHNDLMAEAQRLVMVVGNNSNLVMDPDVDSHYLVDAVVFKLPKLSEDLSQLRAAGPEAISASNEIRRLEDEIRQADADLSVNPSDATLLDKRSKSAKERDDLKKALLAAQPELKLLIARIDAVAQEANASLSFAAAAATGSHAKATLEPLVVGMFDGAGAFTWLVAKEVLVDKPVTAERYLEVGATALAANRALQDATTKLLRGNLEDRVTRFKRERLTSMGAVALALVITLLLLVLVVRAVTKPIAHLSHVAERISLGELDIQIAIDSKDEIGALGEQFRRLQVSLKAAMDQLEARDSAEG